MQEFIEIYGARENNLQNVNLKIPKRKITIFTGVSGSGKSSIVFETIAQEAGRQLNENFSNFVRGFLPKYTQPDVEEIKNLSMAVVVDQSRIGGNARSTLGTITDISPLLRLLFSRVGQPYVGPAWNFSFNDPHGMCPTCQGLGKIVTLNLDHALDFSKSLNDGAILLPGHGVGTWMWKQFVGTDFFDNDLPIKDYSKEQLDKLLYAKPEKVESLLIEGMNSTYEGLVEKFQRQQINTANVSEAAAKKMKPFLAEENCYACHGTRFNPQVLACKINGQNLPEMLALQIDELLAVLAEIKNEEVAPLLASLVERLKNLADIGLDYLSLNRQTATLSGGESQRVKMVKHLSSSLTDVLYIFDEPSIGLHPRDVHRLNELLKKLRDNGNTVIVVEHDPDVIQIADYLIDVGPLAGRNGGQIMFSGSYEDLLKSDTLTGKNMKRQIPFKTNPRTPKEFYQTEPSTLHNLKNTVLKIPQGLFTVVTGVAGSGKSTLVNGVFAKQFPEAILIDQSAVSTNIRSNPGTYTGIMDNIRKLFAAKNNVSVGLFSYNSQGACPTCGGHGVIKTNLSFMDTVETVCQDCHGTRYKEEVLQYHLGGKNIVDILDLTISEALIFFENKDILKKLTYIEEVGLGYMTLGQPLNTLSGGECQRLKLAKELNKKGNIYIMDEPTTGLHMADIQSILKIIDKLIVKGNTVIVIEHNTEVMKSADWLIDVGVDGGIFGGEILFNGHPENLKNESRSLTAQYLF
ncbi:ATP-binding cassette domain-containing protein [Enterococcus timonensis]|uniref:ATP-binding cassette domain-containing protein n=1 Tax=Enterococcus timonensis TaxID=1852364 RepID=UPI000AB7251E|nr:excinuclease ABC subunit UvrA [Enterococcus timonensis]